MLDLSIRIAPPQPSSSDIVIRKRRHHYASQLEETRALDRVVSVASSVFVVGSDICRHDRRNSACTSISVRREEAEIKNTLALSKHATLGRNSDFTNLTSEDREKLGGIEYRSLRLLVKIVVGK